LVADVFKCEREVQAEQDDNYACFLDQYGDDRFAQDESAAAEAAEDSSSADMKQNHPDKIILFMLTCLEHLDYELTGALANLGLLVSRGENVYNHDDAMWQDIEGVLYAAYAARAFANTGDMMSVWENVSEIIASYPHTSTHYMCPIELHCVHDPLTGSRPFVLNQHWNWSAYVYDEAAWE